MNINSTGTYRNDEKQQWEAWSYDVKTDEKQLIGACSYLNGEQGRYEWEYNLWRRWLNALTKRS